MCKDGPGQRPSVVREHLNTIDLDRPELAEMGKSRGAALSSVRRAPSFRGWWKHEYRDVPEYSIIWAMFD